MLLPTPQRAGGMPRSAEEPAGSGKASSTIRPIPSLTSQGPGGCNTNYPSVAMSRCLSGGMGCMLPSKNSNRRARSAETGDSLREGRFLVGETLQPPAQVAEFLRINFAASMERINRTNDPMLCNSCSHEARSDFH